MNANQNVSTFPQQTSVGDLSNVAMLVTLSIKTPPLSKKDKEATEETASTHNADEKAVSVSRKLYTKEMVSTYTKPTRLARKMFDELTSPWGKGVRIMKASQYQRLVEAFDKHEKEFWAGVDTFLDGIEDKIEQMRKFSGSLFNEDDYILDREVLRAEFDFQYSFLPVPESGDFRVNLGAAQMERVRQSMEEDKNRRVAETMRAPWERMFNVLKEMAEKLKNVEEGNAKYAKDTVLTNVTDLLDALPGLNIMDDPQLSQMAAEIKKAFDGLEPGMLRTPTEKSKQVRQTAEALSKQVGNYMDGLL